MPASSEVFFHGQYLPYCNTMSALVDQIAELHKTGVEIILISSGAVASGRSEVHPAKKLDSVDQRQLFSAVGQAKLINRYSRKLLFHVLLYRSYVVLLRVRGVNLRFLCHARG